MPFLRRYSSALSTSPSVSFRAFLQSIMPAPVFSRSDLTSLAEIWMFFSAAGGASSAGGASAAGAASSAGVASFLAACSATSSAKSFFATSIPSPRLYRANLRTWMFSPSLATASCTACFTVLLVSRMYACSSSAFSPMSLVMRPSTIFSRMFSGLESRSSLPISSSFSFATHAASASPTSTYITSGLAATCMATVSTSSLKSGLRATKSVSQFTSSSTPMRLPAWM
mmetsp:Transcript_6742/g.19081  ORF Transcript_6742/g.19081 Transcript_6742/m.19081 type:complete len:227 (+) Transcript_6742:664-1344(+)